MKDLINTTTHTMKFLGDNGNIHEVPPYGVYISFLVVEEDISKHCSGAQLISNRFVATPSGESALSILEEKHPGKAIVGTVMTAQAYPGRVLAPVTVSGFEQMPPGKRLLHGDKFLTFARGDKQDGH